MTTNPNPNPNDLVAYEFAPATLCRQCVADALDITPEEIEATLDRRANELGLDRYNPDAVTPEWFPVPVWRTQVAVRSPEDEACTNCGQSLLTAPAIVPGPQAGSFDNSFTPEFDTEFPHQGMSI